ncbi:MAG: sorbosone dehydrogenase family protein, partial [Bacteroidota bacterium]
MNKKSIAPGLILRVGVLLLLVAGLTGCAKKAQDASLGYGPKPVLPAPDQTLLPVMKVPTAIGWADGEAPTAAQGLAVSAFASGLDHPRWLYVLPNGDVLVAETNAPANRPDDSKGIKGFFFKL